MAATLDRSTISLSVSAVLKSIFDLGQGSVPVGFSQDVIFTEGNGANQAGNVFSDQRTTDDTGENLDLAGGLNNAFGEAITFTAIKALIVRAAAANTLDVVVGGAATNQFVNWVGAGAHAVHVRPGGVLVLVAPDADGYAVTASTGDLLKIAAAVAGNVTYDIILIGED
ncbi:MAG: hypothetical protein AAFX92_06200 [Pseudomonadota bacterium]